MREWKDHAQVGQEFQLWLDEFLKTYKMIDPEQERQQNPTPGQSPQPGTGEGPEPSPSKRARTENIAPVDASLVISANDVTQALIHEIKMQSGWPMLHVRAEGAAYLLNNTDKNWVQTNPVVAFFGPGSYKILKADQPVPDKAILLDLSGHADQITLNGVVTTIGEAVTTMRQKKPDCKVCYHQILEGSSMSEFGLKSTHKVIFLRKDEDAEKLGKHNIAPQLPFNGSGCLKLVWHMRWCQKGLTPVKPALHVSGAVSLPPAHALKLH